MRLARAILTLAVLAALLAACSSLSLPAAAKVRALDYLNDDIARLVLAFDMPETLEPMPEGSVVSFVVTTGGGGRKVEAVLVRADAEAVAGNLPPPPNGRVYYLFGFSDADRQVIRNTQAWAKAQGEAGQTPNALSIGLAPKFCSTTSADPAKVRFSVLLVLSGIGALEPLVSNASFKDVLGQSGVTLPMCEGHSG